MYVGVVIGSALHERDYLYICACQCPYLYSLYCLVALFRRILGLRLLNLSFHAYGWLYMVLMDLTLVHCIHTFEGCGRGHDVINFLKVLRARLL